MEKSNYSEIKDSNNKKGISAEKVVAILKKSGTTVSIEEAVVILEFMKKIADIAVNQYLSVNKD